MLLSFKSKVSLFISTKTKRMRKEKENMKWKELGERKKEPNQEFRGSESKMS